MSRARFSALAWSLAFVGVSLTVAGALVAAVGGAAVGDVGLFFVLVLIPAVATSIVGGLVASKQPENPIGWIFCGFSVFRGVSALAAGYAAVAPANATLGVGQAAAWFSNWAFVALFTLAIFVLLLFPDGRLLGRRWRWATWCGALGTVAVAAGTALDPGPLPDYREVTNPVAIDARIAGGLLAVGAALTIVALAAAVISVVVRYRRASDTGRQQIKCLAAAGTLTLASAGVGTVIVVVVNDVAGYSLILAGIIAIPVGIAVAMLRYRLYDVDRLISRSLTYALVTLTLGGAYVGLVLAGQAVFSSFAGGGDLAIASSTLVVAALFFPLRSRLQRLVDRRFYRRRYDAQRTLEAFGARLREQVELDTLSVDLTDVVRETMEPVRVSVWLRQEAPR